MSHAIEVCGGRHYLQSDGCDEGDDMATAAPSRMTGFPRSAPEQAKYAVGDAQPHRALPAPAPLRATPLDDG